MSCNKHLMGFHWERHAWERRVTLTESQAFPVTDQWGRVNRTDHVTCHAQYVCRVCGATRDGEECSCDRARAEACAVRLAHLKAAPEHVPGAPA